MALAIYFEKQRWQVHKPTLLKLAKPKQRLVVAYQTYIGTGMATARILAMCHA
jgi:hypothetical protein